MADEPSANDDKEAERRFQETLGRLVNTPHKPHNTKTPPGEPGGGRASDKARDQGDEN